MAGSIIRGMTDWTSFEAPAAGPTSSSSRTARLVRRTVAALGRNWHETLYLQRRLVDARRPWDERGPLRWQHQLGGWRMVGSYLPDDGRTASPTA